MWSRLSRVRCPSHLQQCGLWLYAACKSFKFRIAESRPPFPSRLRVNVHANHDAFQGLDSSFCLSFLLFFLIFVFLFFYFYVQFFTLDFSSPCITVLLNPFLILFPPQRHGPPRG